MNASAESPRAVERRAADYPRSLLAGLAAGLATIPPMMIGATLLMGMDAWSAPKMAWSLVAGPEVIRPGFEVVPVLGGLAVHFALSGFFGLVFAGVASLLPASIWLGAAFGLGLYVTNVLAAPKLLPSVAGHMFPASPAMHLAFIAQNVLFGALLAWAYRAWRR